MNHKEIKIDLEDVQLIMGIEFPFFEKILSNVYCGNCYQDSSTTTIVDYEIFLNDLNDLLLKGTCKRCGGPVARYIETGESKDKAEVAKHIKMVKKKYATVADKNSPKPKVASGKRVFEYDEYMAMLDEGVKFESSLVPIYKEFTKHLLGRGWLQREIDQYLNTAKSFVGYCSMKHGVRWLTEITKGMLTKHLTLLDNAIGGKPTGRIYQNEEAHIIRQFFTFIHKEGGITNKRVLGAFYSAQELKEMGIK